MSFYFLIWNRIREDHGRHRHAALRVFHPCLQPDRGWWRRYDICRWTILKNMCILFFSFCVCFCSMLLLFILLSCSSVLSLFFFFSPPPPSLKGKRDLWVNLLLMGSTFRSCLLLNSFDLVIAYSFFFLLFLFFIASHIFFVLQPHARTQVHVLGLA